MKLTGHQVEDILVLRPEADRLDAANAIFLKDEFREATDGHTGRIVLDMTGIAFIDSSGLGALVSALKTLKGRPLELAGLNPIVNKVISLTRMDLVFRIHPTLGDALGCTGGADAA